MKFSMLPALVVLLAMMADSDPDFRAGRFIMLYTSGTDRV